ncbi:hypothetical protein BDV25DRAFT_153097 [Aspergillus avenaceus]|uniref:Uncharacterized protein n=1 Tax=Aspergillus avenaceus TaxID=36643 RepID=A0A5N6TY97_ASPAV|nr:hypothetical protein BDV25DRAFT_153097 [Aspergillus avenaceus]
MYCISGSVNALFSPSHVLVREKNVQYLIDYYVLFSGKPSLTWIAALRWFPYGATGNVG